MDEENTYGDERAGHLGAAHAQGAVPDFLDLLPDRGEGENAGLGHVAIETARRVSMMARIGGGDARLHGVGGCDGRG